VATKFETKYRPNSAWKH